MGMLWFDSPAEQWSQALPIGNGRLGAMIFGGNRREIIQLNQDSIWYGGKIDRVNPDAKANLEKVRSLILEGKIPQAEELLAYAFSGTPQSQRCYQPLGNIELTYFCLDQETTQYRRELDLEAGRVEESFRVGNIRMKKEYLACDLPFCVAGEYLYFT